MDTDGGKLLPIGTTTGDLINKQNKRVDMDARNHTLPPMDHARKDKPESSNCSTYCSKKYNAREQQNQICCDIEVFQCSGCELTHDLIFYAGFLLSFLKKYISS